MRAKNSKDIQRIILDPIDTKAEIGEYNIPIHAKSFQS